MTTVANSYEVLVTYIDGTNDTVEITAYDLNRAYEVLCTYASYPYFQVKMGNDTLVIITANVKKMAILTK